MVLLSHLHEPWSDGLGLWIQRCYRGFGRWGVAVVEEWLVEIVFFGGEAC